MTTTSNQTPAMPAKPKPAPAVRPVPKLQTGSDLGKAAGKVVKGAGVVAGTVVGEITGAVKDGVESFMETYLPMFGTVWFSNGKKLMGLIHLLICCVGIPVGVYISGLGGNAPLAHILKFAAAVVGAWVVGFVLTLIGSIVGDAKNGKEALRNLIIAVVAACAFIVYEAFFS